jgi:hypothetical protein
MQFILILLAAAIALAIFMQFWYLFAAGAAGYLAYRLIRELMKNRYFSSPEFLAQKEEISSVIAEHNEVSDYIGEIHVNRAFHIGSSESGSNAHLASFENTSKYAYKRDKNKIEYGSKFVHNSSLQVVRNASIEPIKYLIKYFDIEATEEKLAEVETLGESVSRLENAIQNLKEREDGISESFAPPKFILKHYLQEFQSHIGLTVPLLEVPYSVYSFEYQSAGGNSGQKTIVKLDSQTIDRLVETLAEKIKFKKSAAGQRALMTAKLRGHIKERDFFTCKICKISTSDEAHLLLEVDHIKPVSKGGQSIEENLQTLCWKCNRTKSNKY